MKNALLWLTFDVSADTSGFVMATDHMTCGNLSHSLNRHIFNECLLCAGDHALLLDSTTTLLFIISNTDFLALLDPYMFDFT